MYNFLFTRVNTQNSYNMLYVDVNPLLLRICHRERKRLLELWKLEKDNTIKQFDTMNWRIFYLLILIGEKKKKEKKG